MGYFLYKGIKEEKENESTKLEGQISIQENEFFAKTKQAIRDLEAKKISKKDFKRIVDLLLTNLYTYFGI